VEAQQQMVDITTNNYQKAIEAFFGHYCSYALTIYFQELKAVKKVAPTADARQKLVKAGLPPELYNEDGTFDMDFESLATEYWVRAIPGSLVEMEDDKQMRILNQLFIPLSQSLPAMVNSGDPNMIRQAARAMQYIVTKQIELSGSSSAKDLGLLLIGGEEEVNDRDAKYLALEDEVHAVEGGVGSVLEMNEAALAQMQAQIALLRESQELILEALGANRNPSGNVEPENQEGSSPQLGSAATVMPASA
jgi:hypothetical protein